MYVFACVIPADLFAGIFAGSKIPANSYVGVYAGEYLLDADGEARGR